MKGHKDKRTLQIGFENSVMVNRIVGIFSVDTNPVKKMISDARQTGILIDLTKDKKTKTAILMDNDYIVLSPINHNTLINRLCKDESVMSKNLLPSDEE